MVLNKAAVGLFIAFTLIWFEYVVHVNKKLAKPFSIRAHRAVVTIHPLPSVLYHSCIERASNMRSYRGGCGGATWYREAQSGEDIRIDYCSRRWLGCVCSVSNAGFPESVTRVLKFCPELETLYVCVASRRLLWTASSFVKCSHSQRNVWQ